MATEFEDQYRTLVARVWDEGQEVEVGEWQSQDVRDKPHMVSRELMHVTFRHLIPFSVMGLQHDVKPNLPWAEDHFQERVSGHPHNPPPSEAWWPYAVQGNEAHKAGEKFSHTYPERFWPTAAGDGVVWEQGIPYVDEFHFGRMRHENHGIRFPYGDLEDLVEQLIKNPQTRQAYLPVWFPEDTGAVQGQRVPCTLGYHFLIRRDKLDIVYYIRSCDLLRHFTDDVYMAMRLAQFVAGKLTERGHPAIRANALVMHISSLHYFRGDYERIRMLLKQWQLDGGYEEEIRGAAI